MKDVKYKWSKIFAAKRYGGKNPINLDALEQDELLNDILSIESPQFTQPAGVEVKFKPLTNEWIEKKFEAYYPDGRFDKKSWIDGFHSCRMILPELIDTPPPPLSNEASGTPEVKGYSRDEVERMISNEGIKYCNKNHLGAAAYSKLHSCFVAGAMYGVSLPTPSTDKL